MKRESKHKSDAYLPNMVAHYNQAAVSATESNNFARIVAIPKRIENKKAGLPYSKAARLSPETRSFPSLPSGRFGFIS